MTFPQIAAYLVLAVAATILWVVEIAVWMVIQGNLGITRNASVLGILFLTWLTFSGAIFVARHSGREEGI